MELFNVCNPQERFSEQQARRTLEKMQKEYIIKLANGGRYAKYTLITCQCRDRCRVKNYTQMVLEEIEIW